VNVKKNKMEKTSAVAMKPGVDAVGAERRSLGAFPGKAWVSNV
jgi:hypothetical protein